jgi:hypothetical protein
MQVVRIDLDLAKYVFEVHGFDKHEKVVVQKWLRRDAVARFFANLPICPWLAWRLRTGRTIGPAYSPNLAMRFG